MINNGLIDEVKTMLPYRHLKSMRTVGYTEIFDHLDGNTSLHEAIELVKRNSRRYAKRQMTWFRNQGTWTFFAHDQYEKILDYVRSTS